ERAVGRQAEATEGARGSERAAVLRDRDIAREVSQRPADGRPGIDEIELAPRQWKPRGVQQRERHPDHEMSLVRIDLDEGSHEGLADGIMRKGVNVPALCPALPTPPRILPAARSRIQSTSLPVSTLSRYFWLRSAEKSTSSDDPTARRPGVPSGAGEDPVPGLIEMIRTT